MAELHVWATLVAVVEVAGFSEPGTSFCTGSGTGSVVQVVIIASYFVS